MWKIHAEQILLLPQKTKFYDLQNSCQKYSTSMYGIKWVIWMVWKNSCKNISQIDVVINFYGADVMEGGKQICT